METAGDALIETMRVRNGRIPFLSRHLARLEGSIRKLGLPTPSPAVAGPARPLAGPGWAGRRTGAVGGPGGGRGTRRRPPRGRGAARAFWQRQTHAHAS